MMRLLAPLLAVLAAILVAMCQRAPETEARPEQVTAAIRAYAAEQCGDAFSLGAQDPGYLNVIDISKDGRPDYLVDFSALRCGGETPRLCPDGSCPREIWVSDGRQDYKLAFGMNVRSLQLDEAATPPALTVTASGDACPPPPPEPISVTPPPPGAPLPVARPPQSEATCQRTFAFDPIRLEFLDADRPGARTAPARDDAGLTRDLPERR